MIAPTLALVAVSLSTTGGPTCDAAPRPTPPTAVVRETSPTAQDHYERDLNLWWGRRALCTLDTRSAHHAEETTHHG